MLSCNILFNYNTRSIVSAMKNYIRADGDLKALEKFVSNFINKSGLPEATRYKFNTLDSNDEILKSIKDFIKAFDDAMLSLISRAPLFTSKLNGLKSEVLNTLQVDLDEHSSGSTPESDSDIETKTTYEVLDLNTANLDAHYADLYGTGAYNIVRQLEESFGDNISAATFFNVITGLPVLQSNSVLNKNIIELKNKYFKTIIDYLKSLDADKYKNLVDYIYDTDDNFVGASYYEGLKAFYNHIKAQPNLKSDLEAQSSLYLQNTHRTKALDLYSKVVTKLLENAQFNKTLTNKYRSNLLQTKVKSSLYEADHLQAHYYDIKKWAERYNLLDNEVDGVTIRDLFKLIESDESTLLNATKAYTSITHFDELLNKSLGDMIDIKQGLKGYELGDSSKYSFKLETAHLKKSWQQSESIESEKYAANLTKQTLNLVRIFNYKTKLFQNRRANVTSVITAARNFIDDIVYGRITANNIKRSKAQESAAKLLVALLTDLHSNPTENFAKAMLLLFGKIEGALEYTRLVDNISLNNTMNTTTFDLSTLYSLYLVFYNLDNVNSIENNELLNIDSSNGPIQMLSNEIASLVARNVTMHYTETTYSETGLPIIKIRKRYSNNAELYKTRLFINSRVVNATKKLTENRQKKHNFEVHKSANNTTYIIHFDNADLTFNSPSIFDSRVLGKYITGADIFRNLANIDFSSFRLKINKGEELTPLEKNLYNVLDFIDTLLGLRILTDQGIQQLEIFNELNDSNIENLTTLAIKAAFVNFLKNNANLNNESLELYLQHDFQEVYLYYQNNTDNKRFARPFNEFQIIPVLYDDSALENWCDAYSILTGLASKSTTKNNEGDSIPNNSVNKLGTNLSHYLIQLKDSNADSLYFVHNLNTIRSVLHDLEVVSLWGDKKLIKNFSQSEMIFHSIFNKFWGSYLNTGNFLILPTCYSDKTTFINYEINSKLFGDTDIVNDSNYVNTIVNNTISTIGTMYKKVLTNSVSKLEAIATLYNSLHDTNLTHKEVLKVIDEPTLMALAKQAGVSMSLDLDYRRVGKHLCPNELLEYYATELYNDPAKLKDFLETQKTLFLLTLLTNDCQFLVLTNGESVADYTGVLPEKRKSRNPIISTILGMFANDSKGRSLFFKNWVDENTGRLILAKLNGKNIIGYLKLSGAVELNPLLDKFFYIEGFLSNNMRMSLTGNELNHPDKASNTAFKLVLKAKSVDDIKDVELTATLLKQLQKFFVDNNIDNVSALKDFKAPKGLAKIIDSIYHKSLTTIANVAQGTLFKRNVIIPATLLYCTPNLFNGIPPKVKVAVIRDEEAPVYNYKGTKEDSIDSADGSAQINPFQSILENMALGSLAVGFIKKPIWHSYDAKTGSAFLAKFATDTITNETMRASLNSHTNLFNLFRKMTNLQWDNVDLMQSITLGNVLGDPILVLQYWTNCLLGNVLNEKENQLYYKDRYGDIIQITGFNKTTTEDGKSFYYTTEAPIIGGVAGKAHKVYHVFNGKEHLTFDTWLQANAYVTANSEAHTINSLFELHTALGSINCVTKDGTYSEFNNLVVANFMNNVGFKKPNATSSKLNLANYEQPLKLYHIGYALNNTAVKNGALNINLSSAWYDNSELNYFEVNSDGLGMQMNADHDIIDSELTEFSLVITATSAYGYTFNLTDELFLGLGKAALATTKKLLTATLEFLENTDDPERALSDLYDAIGRIVLTSASIKDKESLQGIIMDAVSKVFYKSKNHAQDSNKIPFSDPNIYSDFVATITSTINKEAIKRKHPGSGCVMVPAYHMILYFEIDGKKLTASDVLNKALLAYKNKLITLLMNHPDYNAKTNSIGDFFINGSSIKYLELKVSELGINNPDKINEYYDTTAYNKTRITNYLLELLELKPLMNDRSWFMPSDNVDIIDNNGKVHTYLLDSMDSYYKFKDGLYDIEIANDVAITYNPKNGSYTITKGDYTCNLTKDANGNWIDVAWTKESAPLSDVAALIVGELTLPNGNIVTKSRPVFKYRENITLPHDLRPSLIRWQDADTGQYVNIFDSPIIKNAYLNPKSINKNHLELVLKELNLIHNGLYTDKYGRQSNIKDGSLENNAAELIMSNLYKEKFGIGNESLAEVLELGEDYFKKRFNKLNVPSNTLYDIVFAKDTGLSTLISLRPVQNNSYILPKEWSANLLYTNEEGKIKVIRGGQDLFTVGKWVNVSDVIYKDGNFTKDGNVLDKTKYRLKDSDDPNSVLERVDFVKLYDFTTKFVTKEGKTLYRNNTMYEMADIETLKKATDDNETDALKLRASIITDIYLADNYKLAQVNRFKAYSAGQLNNVKSSLGWFFNNDYIDDDVKDLLASLLNDMMSFDFKLLKSEDVEEVKAAKDDLKQYIADSKIKYDDKLNAFYNSMAHKRYVSFLDSLNFIAARIPALSLLSFMTMKNIAWTENSKNIAYVSHFLTFLLGSRDLIII